MLVQLPAHAATLGVRDLRLQADAAWQRGTPQQEEEDDALHLSWAGAEGVALQLLVPRNPTLIKSDPDTFYRNLARKWREQYGSTAAIGWTDLSRDGAGGVRWLGCRRPASSGEGVVFQLAAVHEGRAYSLLLFAPPGTEALPRVVLDLMAQARFQSTTSRWRLAQALALLPRGEALEALLQAEAEALGDQGMLTGHELKAGQPAHSATAVELRMHWSLDGFLWRRGFGRDERLPFEMGGELTAEAASELAGGSLRLVLRTEAEEKPLAARVSQHAYCGPRGTWEEAWAALQRGSRAPLSRLAREQSCQGQADEAGRVHVEADPGQAVERTLPLLPAPAKAVGRWVEIRLAPAAGSAGEILLDRPGLYFAYEPMP